MRILFVTIMAVLAVLVAACDGSDSTTDPDPTTSGTTTAAPTSPSPSQTGPLTTGPGVRPGEQPPVLTAEAKAHTPTGALLFANYYFKALDWSIATNDPYLVREIAAPSCAACRRVIDGLGALVKERASLSGGRITLRSSKVVTGRFKVKSDFVVKVSLTEEAEVIDRPSVAPSTSVQATKDTSFVFVSWVGNEWQVKEVGAPS
jgi:hypothetical protein